MNKIKRIEVEDHDVTFFFEGTDEPFNAREFSGFSLRRIESLILDYNFSVKIAKKLIEE